MTLNSLENHPDKVANEVANMIHNNRRGSNFQNPNAFDETLQESPIKQRFDADGTTFIEKGIFVGETPDERQHIKAENNRKARE